LKEAVTVANGAGQGMDKRPNLYQSQTIRPIAARQVVAVAMTASIVGLTGPIRAIELPAAGINAAAYNYWGTALPFVDVAHMGEQWMPVTTNSRAFEGVRTIATNSDGYPMSLEPGEVAQTLVFTHNGGFYPTGQYTLTWAGNGEVRMAAPGVAAVQSAGRRIVYRVPATNPSGLRLEITATDPANPVHNIRLLAPFAGGSGRTFNPGYAKDFINYGVIRFMDWNMTNNHTVSNWSNRATPSDFHWGSKKGVPYEFQIQLCNELKRDAWITVPHLADDDYVRNLAKLVEQKLSPELRVWVEYSNEVWNGSFQQYRYANDVLRPRYRVENPARAYGRRSAEVFDIFTSETSNHNRIVRVIAGQAANSWVLEQSLLGATADGNVNADVAAVAPYFSVDIDKLYQQHQQGAVNLDAIFAELRSNIDSIISRVKMNQQVAAARGLPLVAYEGGQHLVARPGEQHNDPRFVELLSKINRDLRMGELYTYLLDKWYAAGGKTFVFFNDVGRPAKWGAWGLKETYQDDNAPKFRAVQDYLQRLSPPANASEREGVRVGDRPSPN
jgi:hypothetical protein